MTIRHIAAVSSIALLAACSTVNELPSAPSADRAPPPVVVAPPPPPPPAMAAPPSNIVVTGSRVVPGVAPPARFAPVVAPVVAPTPNREQYEGEEVSPVRLTAQTPLSTFSIDVDTGAYANTRRFLQDGQRPPEAAVRTEEFVNYFRYDYPAPVTREQPFTVSLDAARTPWNDATRLVRIGLRGYDIARDERPPANLVFLVDVSGSMGTPDKLPLVKTALRGLARELGPDDRVSIVVYAGAAGRVLDPTNDAQAILAALDRLEAGGSTAGAAGLRLAYDTARQAFIEGGVNRVLVATDGDFNVGVSDTDALIDMIEEARDSGVTLTTLGFGTGNYNEAMMEQIADHGNGNYAYIDSALEAQKVLGDEMSSTLFTIAKDVKIQVEFNPAVVSQYRLIGYENRALRDEDFANDQVDAGEIGAGHQVTALYEVVPAGTEGWIAPLRYQSERETPGDQAAQRPDEAAFVRLRYKLPDGDRSILIERALPSATMRAAPMPKGDFAFVAAVASFAQALRGDPLLGGFGPRDAAALAGAQRDYWRQEFVRLAMLAQDLPGNATAAR